MAVIDTSAADIKNNAAIQTISKDTGIQTISTNASILNITLAP